MGAYLRGRWWWYKRQLDKRVYRRPLKIRKGQETMMSARIAQAEEDIMALHFGLERAGRPSVLLSEYRTTWLEAKRHKATADRDRQRLEYIGRAWPDLPLNFYTKAHVEVLEKRLTAAGPTGRPSKPATINRYMELLRSMFNAAIEDGLLHENPLRHYEPYAEEGTRRALDDGEIGRVVDAARALAKVKNFRLGATFAELVIFALATGMRLGEILNLRRAWVNGDLVAIPLAQTKSRRRGAAAPKQRFKIVGLSPLAQRIVNRQPEAGEYVFSLHRRDVMVVQHGVEAIRRMTGISDFTFHHLRHTASTIVASRASLATARVVLGHADLRTTLRYTHPSIKEQRETVTNLGTYLEGIVGSV